MFLALMIGFGVRSGEMKSLYTFNRSRVSRANFVFLAVWKSAVAQRGPATTTGLFTTYLVPSFVNHPQFFKVSAMIMFKTYLVPWSTTRTASNYLPWSCSSHVPHNQASVVALSAHWGSFQHCQQTMERRHLLLLLSLQLPCRSLLRPTWWPPAPATQTT